MADRKRPFGILLAGLKGEIIVNGGTYDSEMPAMEGSDLSIASVLTHVRNQFNGAQDSMGDPGERIRETGVILQLNRPAFKGVNPGIMAEIPKSIA